MLFRSESNVGCGYYNVGTGVQTTIKELCDLILQLRSSDLKVTFKPYAADDARQFVKNRIASTEKATTEIGFEYTTSLEQGLLRLIDWRQTHNS